MTLVLVTHTSNADNFINRFLRERGMASTPKMEYVPGFYFHFPKELSYGYLRFEGNGKNLSGK